MCQEKIFKAENEKFAESFSFLNPLVNSLWELEIKFVKNYGDLKG